MFEMNHIEVYSIHKKIFSKLLNVSSNCSQQQIIIPSYWISSHYKKAVYGDFKTKWWMIKHLYQLCITPLLQLFKGYTNQLPVVLHYLQQNIEYQNHRSTDIVTQILKNVRKIAMSHMTAVEKRGEKQL